MDSIANNNYRFRSLVSGTVLFLMAAFVLAACSSGGGGGGGADLVIEPTDEGWDFQVTASVSSAAVVAGEMFTLTAMVKNADDAGASAPASTLTYYQSSDATISFSDSQIATDPVSSLAVGESSTQSFNATAPMIAGTYYYGACMPAALGEINPTDNCSAGVAVTVTGDWDFQVTAMVSSASVAGSTPFTLTAMVSNASGASGPAPASTLSYYQSTDATIDSTDTSVGTDPVASLAAGASSTESIDLTAPAVAGTYYYGACMPATGNELNATDNCSSGVAVTFTSGWDFQVTASAASVVLVGEAFTLTTVISNAGIANQASSASTLTYYQSTDDTIDSTDTSLGTDAVASLAVGASDTQDITPTAPMTAGTAYYGACMPATSSELVASDNCSAGVAVTFSSGWDFQVTVSASSTSVAFDDTVTLTAMVSNADDAGGPAPASTLRYYRSDDATIDSSDSFIGMDAVPSLAVGVSSTQSISRVIKDIPGTYYYGACMPATSGEADATDNCSGVAVTVEGGWDFQVTASVSSTSVEVGDTLTVTAEVSNNANIATAPTVESTLTYYSYDVQNDSYTTLGVDTVPVLAVGDSSTQDIDVMAPATAGTYLYLACMPDGGDEVDPEDNCSTTNSQLAPTVTVTAASGS
ncbi:MAG: CARDB domain-containing protein [Gammaproteobacteria bacterium]